MHASVNTKAFQHFQDVFIKELSKFCQRNLVGNDKNIGIAIGACVIAFKKILHLEQLSWINKLPIPNQYAGSLCKQNVLHSKTKSAFLHDVQVAAETPAMQQKSRNEKIQ